MAKDEYHKELVKRQPLVVEVRCPRCYSSNTLYRKKTNNHYCRKCGKVFSVKSYRKKNDR